MAGIRILCGSSLVRAPELGLIAGNVHGVFGAPVEHTRETPPLERAYDRLRGQYNSTALLEDLVARGSALPDRQILVVDVDLFVPVLTFVFGEAQLTGTSAVVSTHRLSPQYYGLPGSHPLLLQRLEKEIIHELGHTFGLRHCRQFECVMRSSTYVEEIDMKRALPCGECSALLRGSGGTPAAG
jgi:archaemetzincin